jgi:hypothetical protein
MTRWVFNRHRPGDRARNSQVEKFFKSDEVADRTNAVVREGIQNSLDASIEDQVNIRIVLGEAHGDAVNGFIPELFAHLNGIRDRVEDVPSETEHVRFLAFEDFNTKGLEGDPEQWKPIVDKKNPFFNFFRGEGVSDKTEDARGRHGVGKLVFAVASRARCLFGLSATQSQDSPPKLMGTATLLMHEREGHAYHPDGWFGIEKPIEGTGDSLVVPVTDPDTIRQFSDAFRLEREHLPGLSIVVPWIHSDITLRAVVEAVVSGYFWPIVQSKLFVDVVEGNQTITIDCQTIDKVVAGLEPGRRKELEPRLQLAHWGRSLAAQQFIHAESAGNGPQKWDKSRLSETARQQISQQFEQGENVAVRLPVRLKDKKGREYRDSHFDLFFHKAPECSDADVSFFREGLLISGVKPSRWSGYRGLVVIEEGALGSFLGDAENPSHTLWQKDNVKGKYTYPEDCLRYVTHSLPNILKTISEEDKQADPTLLIDVFSLPADKPDSKGKLPQGKDSGGKSPVPKPDIRSGPPKRFLSRQTASGFVIKAGKGQRPQRLEVEVAYGVRKGNPFNKYDPADFDLSKRPIQIQSNGATVSSVSGNLLVVEPLQDDFEVEVSGFDTNRDLYINPRVTSEEDGHAEEV